MSTVVKRRHTPEEYLALERASPYRSEYVNGQIYAMTGASQHHNFIVGNIFAKLHAQMEGRPCEAYVNEMRVKVSETGLYTYPDVAALCGEAKLEDGHKDTLLNPSVIFEVLSKSTELYDRSEKFAHYRRLESLREYILVAQSEVRVERFVRQGEQWVLSEYRSLDDSLPIESIGCTLALRDIYARVQFSPSGE